MFGALQMRVLESNSLQFERSDCGFCSDVCAAGVRCRIADDSLLSGFECYVSRFPITIGGHGGFVPKFCSVL